MYCPVCFNQTLKIASSGVVKVTFNNKARNTSQFFYDLKRDRASDIDEKFRKVVVEYFSWYASFANKSVVDDVQLTTIDFVCSRGCKITLNNRMSAVDLVIMREAVNRIVSEEGVKFNIPTGLK